MERRADESRLRFRRKRKESDVVKSSLKIFAVAIVFSLALVSASGSFDVGTSTTSTALKFEDDQFVYTYPRTLDLDAGILHNYISQELFDGEYSRITGVTVDDQIYITFDHKLTGKEKRALGVLMEEVSANGVHTFAYKCPRMIAYEANPSPLHKLFDGDYVWLHFEKPLTVGQEAAIRANERKETKGEMPMPPVEKPAEMPPTQLEGSPSVEHKVTSSYTYSSTTSTSWVTVLTITFDIHWLIAPNTVWGHGMIESYNTGGMFRMIMMIDNNPMPIYTYYYGRDYYATFNCRTYSGIRTNVGRDGHHVDMKIAVQYGSTGYYLYKHMFIMYLTP